MGPFLLRRQLGATECFPGRGAGNQSVQRILEDVCHGSINRQGPGLLRSSPKRAEDAARWISRTGLVISTPCASVGAGPSRGQLLSLSDQMLSDIGVSRVDVFKECEKPFWRP